MTKIFVAIFTAFPSRLAWLPMSRSSASGEDGGGGVDGDDMKARIGDRGGPTGPFGLLVGQGLVDELPQLRADRVGAGREQLGEERDGQLFAPVDPERGARGPAPGELARRADHLAGHRVEDDGEAEAGADPA